MNTSPKPLMPTMKSFNLFVVVYKKCEQVVDSSVFEYFYSNIKQRFWSSIHKFANVIWPSSSRNIVIN